MAAGSSEAATCHCSAPASCVDRRAGRYLVSIYRADRDGGGPVSTGAVSDRLDVSPATVTERFDRLASAGLVDYEKHGGVELTDRGREVARDLSARTSAVGQFFGALDARLSTTTAYRIGFALPASGIAGVEALLEDGLAADGGDPARAEPGEPPADDAGGA